MELYSAEAKALNSQVKEWLEHDGYELEATFGKGGSVDQTTFLSVAKRLRSKGYTSRPQEDSLRIMTKEHVRFTIASFGVIQQYCRDDTLAGKPYTAMIKDRAVPLSNLDIDEYGVRIKTRREVPMANDDASIKKLLENWSNVPKAFRMIRRWTFETEGCRIDMSIVKSTKTISGGGYKWQKKYRDQDIMQSPPIFEIEVELLKVPGESVDTGLKRLVKGCGEVLRGIQKNTFLIRESERLRVLGAYKLLVNSDKFRGPATINLQKKNFSKDHEAGQANIRDGYNVTDKADGLRCLGFCDNTGELFLIDMSVKNVYRTGLRNPECRLSMVDGEWVTLNDEKSAVNQFLIFDIIYTTDKKDVSQFPFMAPAADKEDESRHGQLTKWIATWHKADALKMIAPGVNVKTRLQVSKKSFLFARPGDDSIFHQARRVLDTARPYYTDGLIFTSNTAPLPAGSGETFYEQFKWKPPKDNTIDFLVKFEKNSDSLNDRVTYGENPETKSVVQYKTIRLFVGSTLENARNIILNGLELPKKNRLMRGSGIRGEYKPVLFTPKEFPDTMASICNLEMHTDPDTGENYVKTESDEPIQDKTIVEMSYNPKAAPGWRWIPLRIRLDKTERLQSGTLGRTLNSDRVAEDVWNSIYDPITRYMITTGADHPNEEEAAELMAGSANLGRKYYDRTAPVQDQMLTRPMRDFHNKYVKERVLYRAGLAGTGKTLIDMSCGVGADLQIWRRQKVSFVLGVDYSDDNIRGDNDSIYRRYLESAVAAGGLDRVPPMVFAVGDSSKNYESGEAGVTEEERNILRSVLGRVKPMGPLPQYVEKEGASRLKMRADCMSCMFSLHYFFQNITTFKGFMKNISDNLKVGGHFIGACFDGEKTFNLLRDTPKGMRKVGTEGASTLWSITKGYDEDDLPDGEDSLGLPIDVEFVTIGSSHREYLVSFRYFVDQMKEIGCELIEAKEAKALGVPSGSEMFRSSWETATKAGGDYKMLPAVEEFSFLNRWFIFKRKQYVGPLETERSGLSSLKAAATEDVSRAATAPAEGKEEEAPEDSAADAEGDKEEAAAAAPSAAPTSKKAAVTYSQGELFLFYPDATEKDVLDLREKGGPDTLSAGQWLSPTAPFPIEDPYADDVLYPSFEHYMAAMRYRVASNTPDIANTLFSKDGKIHQDILRKRLIETEGGKKPVSPARERALMKEEIQEVLKAIRPATFKKYKSTFNDAAWAEKKMEVLREGLRQRWETDDRFRKIIEKAREMGKTLLYYTPGANASNMGGVRKNSGVIEGENMVGKIMMELAGF